jgi:hypothetical protein
MMRSPFGAGNCDGWSGVGEKDGKDGKDGHRAMWIHALAGQWLIAERGGIGTIPLLQGVRVAKLWRSGTLLVLLYSAGGLAC